MNKKDRFFRFKQFSVAHDQSAMKVGVDGVLLGAWADLEDSKRILDVGCGCGLIAIMAAQRNAKAQIRGIDIHAPSVAEATSNAESTLWGDRVAFELCNFEDYKPMLMPDHIISNPPFFDAGTKPQSDRELTRHSSELGPLTLISVGSKILDKNGKISMIAPPEWLERIKKESDAYGFVISRLTYVYSRPARSPKRILVELKRRDSQSVSSEISLLTNAENSLYIECEDKDGTFCYSEEYRKICSPFYLKF